MPQDHSFDIVSKINLQELQNALQQAQKELGTRFDFRNTSAGLEFDEEAKTLQVTADHEPQLRSVLDVLNTKLAKRGVSIKSLAWKSPEQLPSGGMKQQASLQQGIASDLAREIVKQIKALGFSKVQPRIDGESVRVTSRQLDDLQAVIQTLKRQEFGVPIQFENYR